jgi:hypothetical protein
MRVCGVGFAGSDAALVVLEAADDGWSIIPSEPGKLTLSDPFDTQAVKYFQTAVRAFLGEHRIQQIVVKKKPHKGKMAAGPAAFAMAAVFQVTSEVPLAFVTAQAIKATLKGQGDPLPPGVNKYQSDALSAAVTWISQR